MPDITIGNGTPRAVYTRPMPGGGQVRIEMLLGDRDITGSMLTGRVVIEPGVKAKSTDDAPIVVEQIQGSNLYALEAELFRIASDNAAIARRMVRRTGEARAD